MLLESVHFWSLSQKREVTLAKFLMKNRDLEDKYFRDLVDGSDSSRARPIPIVTSWVSSLQSIDPEVVKLVLGSPSNPRRHVYTM